MKLRTLIGIIFASPLTLITLLFYIIPFSLLGWYKYVGWFGLDKSTNNKSPLGAAPVWVVQSEKCPIWLSNYWSNWGGHCVGTAVVVKYQPGSSKRANTFLTHELHHAHQIHKFGILQPLFYIFSSLYAKLAGEDAYAANVFEMAARRVAGQIVDPQSFIMGYSSAKNQTNNSSKDL